ncbi:MAG: substrate-binding domain-containing protein [Candidatus Methylacidiphilales bacterium]
MEQCRMMDHRADQMDRKRVALVMSDVFLRRLMPALSPGVRSRRDFWIIDIHRPPSEVVRLLRQLKPAAILTEDLPGRTEAVLSCGIPAVVADTDEIDPRYVAVDVDDQEVGRSAADFLMQSGYRHFAVLANGTSYAAQRQKGFCSRLAERGYGSASYLHREPSSAGYMEHFSGTHARLVRWLESLPRPCALFAVHDPLGRLVCEVAAVRGLAVPEDLAVLGANDDELVCPVSYPALSSVSIPWLRIGAVCGAQLEALLNGSGKPGTSVLIAPGPVRARGSTEWAAVDEPMLRRAMEWMRLHYQQPVTIGTLCDTLKMNRRTLERKFHQHVKRSPRDQLLRLRLDRARQLLLETDQTMDTVAAQCGFLDGERLAVVFRSACGEPPSAYRRRVRGEYSIQQT